MWLKEDWGHNYSKLIIILTFLSPEVEQSSLQGENLRMTWEKTTGLLEQVWDEVKESIKINY
jgi:hypothetical protein